MILMYRYTFYLFMVLPQTNFLLGRGSLLISLLILTRYRQIMKLHVVER
jgi:hypothetical protein